MEKEQAEMLIRMDANLINLSTSFTELKTDTKTLQTDNQKEHKELRNVISNQGDKFLMRSTFWKILSLLTGLGSVGVLVKIFLI